MGFWTLLPVPQLTGERFLHVPTQTSCPKQHLGHVQLQAASRDSWNAWEKSKTKALLKGLGEQPRPPSSRCLPERVNAQPGHDEHDPKEHEESITQTLVLGIIGQFCSLQETRNMRILFPLCTPVITQMESCKKLSITFVQFGTKRDYYIVLLFLYCYLYGPTRTMGETIYKGLE